MLKNRPNFKAKVIFVERGSRACSVDATACKEAGPVGGASLYSDLTTSPWQPQTGTIVCSQGISHIPPFIGEYQKGVFFYPDIILGKRGEFQGNETLSVPQEKCRGAPNIEGA